MQTIINISRKLLYLLYMEQRSIEWNSLLVTEIHKLNVKNSVLFVLFDEYIFRVTINYKPLRIQTA